MSERLLEAPAITADNERLQGAANGQAAADATQDANDARWRANVHPPAWQNPTPSGVYNLVVIGGGSAGLVAAVGAAGLGAKVALIERHHLGGDCLNVGCVPSKSLIRPAKLLGEIVRGPEMGIHLAQAAQVDFGAVMARMRRIRADISEHDSAERFKQLGVDVFLGEGRFRGRNRIDVAGQPLDFKRALIATGSRPSHLPIPGLAEAGVLTNETLFDLTEQPRRLAVIGAGPIGAEMAQVFRRFGSEVTLFDVVPRCLAREDMEAAALIERVFVREGMRLALGARIQRVESGPQGKAIFYEVDGEARADHFDEILVAAGRTPNIDSLGLEAAGVDYTQQGVTVDDALRTTNRDIYAAGDVALQYQFTHTADASARIVLQNALFPGPKKKVSDLVIPWSTYTDPEIAHVGLYPQDAAAAGLEIDTYSQPIAATDRGRTDGEQEGFVKVHVRKGSDQIVGATIVARHAGEMISEITLAMVAGVGLKTLSTVIHPYPTQAEAIKKVADAYNRTRLTPRVHRLFSGWLAWTRR